MNNRKGIKEVAELLREKSLVRDRRSILLPPFLYDNDQSREHVYRKAVQPYWDESVAWLEERRYTDLAELLKHISKDRSSVHKRIEAVQQEVFGYQLLLLLFRHESDVYGPDKTLWDSLGVDPKSSRVDSWTWSIQKSLNRNSVYELSPSPALKNSFSIQKPVVVPFALIGHLTWKIALERLIRVGTVRQELLDSHNDLYSILQFRYELLEAVLSEYRVFGYVPPFDELIFEQPELPEPTLEDIEIIKHGVELYHENPDEYQNREALLIEIIKSDELRIEDLDIKTLQDRLERVGLYNKKRGIVGRPKNVDIEGFVKELVKLWEDFLKKGKRG